MENQRIDFQLNTTNPDTEVVPKYRLYLMRFLFTITFIFLGRDAWTEIFTHQGAWNSLEGVAYSFWAAYSTLMILGLRHPLKMTPLLLLQFFYKSIWLIAVALPLWRNNNLNEAQPLTTIFLVGIALDLIVIPWKYAFRMYIYTPSKPVYVTKRSLS